MDELGKVEKIWPLLTGAGVGALGLWKAFASHVDGRRRNEIELRRLVQEETAVLLKERREEIEGLRERLAGVEQALNDLHDKHLTMIADKDAEIGVLRAEKRALEAELEALKRWITAQGLPVPAGGVTKVLTAAAGTVEAGPPPPLTPDGPRT